MNKLRLSLAFLLLAMFVSLGSQAAEFVEGTHYKKLTQPQPTQTGDKIEVLELFWYGCSHCFRFESFLQRWKRRIPDNTEFIIVPAIFTNPQWELHARAYYTAKALGIVDKIHRPMFDAIHVHKQKLKDENALRKLFVKHGGIKSAEFDDAFNSFSVDSKVRRSKGLSLSYGISGVPSVVINGKYVTDGPMAGNHRRMIQVMNFLIKKEQQAQKKK